MRLDLQFLKRLVLSAAVAFCGLSSAMAATQERIECSSDAFGDGDCRVVNPALTGAAESFQYIWEISYDFACYSGVYESELRISGGNGPMSQPLKYATRDKVTVEGYGPLVLADADPDRTASDYHNSGCRLIVSGITKNPSNQELIRWADHGANLVQAIDLMISLFSTRQEIVDWFNAYIANPDGVQPLMVTMINSFSAGPDAERPYVKLRIKKMQEIIDRAPLGTIMAQYDEIRSQLENARGQAVELKNRFVNHGMTVSPSVDTAINLATQRLQ